MNLHTTSVLLPPPHCFQSPLNIYHGPELPERADTGAEHDGRLPHADEALHLGLQALHEQHSRSDV